MTMRNWTLEERERYAFVTGSPLAPLLAVAATGVDKNTHHLNDMVGDLEKERDDLAQENQELKDAIEAMMEAPTMIEVRNLCAGML